MAPCFATAVTNGSQKAGFLGETIACPPPPLCLLSLWPTATPYVFQFSSPQPDSWSALMLEEQLFFKLIKKNCIPNLPLQPVAR
jgi:hypothetical protein